MATAGAAVDDDDGSADKPQAAEPLAAHNQIEGTNVTVPPGSQNFAGVTCPAGQVPTGGGFRTSGFDIYATDSYASGTGWSVFARNTGTTAQQVRAVVVCTVP
ncbi:hypothetical protein E1265_29435 [Streptomyces sp. 8K308]|uniref:hypothetical protein n=1 Tax=Streptomyces sp. 8K308 TaxID=2530388 RepID=UPI0010481D6E|nr:hypothetical protein [Streptomyces sp. 8K308]TDC12657.1 hypothetical protein E1265_29435 [Streptomyces sp. 8K308]